MWKKMATGCAVLALALAMVTTADAQRRGGGRGWWGGNNWGGYDGRSGITIYTPGSGYYGDGRYTGNPYYGRGYYTEPFFPSQPYYSGTMPYSNQGFEEADQGAQPAFTQPRSDETMVRVFLPTSDARVTFDGSATQQRGMDRVFISSLPNRNKDYTYTIRAAWNEDGRDMNRERKVKVRAGQSVTVDFRADSGNDGAINRDSNRDTNRDNNRNPDANRDNRSNPPD